MVKPGYKQTEIGVIPEDWEVSRWEDCFSGFTSGATPYRGKAEYYNGSIKWVTSGELKYNTIFDTIEHISDEAKAETHLVFHPAGTFLMAITGLEAAGTRGSCALLGIEATTNQSCLAIYGSTKADTRFLYYYYLNNGDNLAFQYCQGTKQQSYTAAIVKKLPIIIPPISEQHRIAEALSDVDELIASLEKLIAKKKAIKQGAMQELLTGKRRLPGFSGEWRETPIKSIGEVITGSTPSRSRPEYWEGKHAWVSARDFNFKYIANTAETVSDTGKKECRFVPKGSILVTCIASIGLNAIAACECATNQQINSIICNPDYDNEFVYYQICAQTSVMKAIAGQTAVPIVSKKQFEDLRIAVPPSLQEQQEIGRTLANIDSELLSFRMQLTKVRQIKQGMMQQLLTGKIRI